MITLKKALSVSQVAAVCGVGRSTVGYWIRSNKIMANRTGRSYSIPVEELLFFLKSTGRNIPEKLAGTNFWTPYFRTIRNCWQYWEDSDHEHNCENCTVFMNQLEVCFTARKISSLRCSASCDECRYYLEIYAPRIEFIHQIDMPATVCNGLDVWGGNRSFAKLCEVQEKDLPGMGVEQVVHPESMQTVVSNVKKRAMGEPLVPRTYSIFFKNRRRGKLKVCVSVYPLNEPAGTSLILAEPEKK